MEWKHGPQHPTPDMEARLRSILSTVYGDFDHRSGAFQGLDYYSPRSIVEEPWAQIPGYEADFLADSITHRRQVIECGISPDPTKTETFGHLKYAAETWIRDSGYRRLPSGYREYEHFNNIPQMRGALFSILESLDLRDVSVDFDDGIVDSSGFFMDTIGHRVLFTASVKVKYGGKLSASFRFPYFRSSSPRYLTSHGLLGHSIFNELGFDPSSEVDRIANINGPPFLEIDRLVSIFRAALSYLRT